MSTNKILTILIALCLPFAVLAAETYPTNVQGVKASIGATGALKITWDAAQDQKGIAFYRVYWSHKSILQNAGDYDDFERTGGPDTSYVFSTLPLPGKTMFIGVLAVNLDGLESEGFEVEAMIDLPATGTSASALPEPALLPSSMNTQPIAVTASSLSSVAPQISPPLFTAIAPASSTGVLLTFSKSLRPDLSVHSFSIRDASGSLLPLRRLTVSGSTILLLTDVQQPGKPYQFFLVAPVKALDGGQLDPVATPLVFYGHVHRDQFVGTVASSSSIAISSAVIPHIASLADPVMPEEPIERHDSMIDRAALQNKDLTQSGMHGMAILVLVAGTLAMMGVKKRLPSA